MREVHARGGWAGRRSRTETRVEQSVRAEQVRTAYSHSAPVLLANVANAIIVVIGFWPSAPGRFLMAWIAAMLALAVGRAFLDVAFRRRSRSGAPAQPWGRLFALGSLTAGLLWGLASLFLLGQDLPIARLVMPFVVAGMVAGAAATVSSYMPAYVAFTAPLLLLMGVALSREQQGAIPVLALMLCVFAVLITRVAWTNNTTLARAFRLRFQHEELLVAISQVRRSLEETNRTLEERVAERGRAIERQSEALRRAQRLESLGLLAGGVAHDFNNLLTVMMGNVDLLLTTRQMSGDERQQLTEVRVAARRAAGLVKQLLAFSRRQSMEPRIVDLSAVLQDARPLLTRVLGSRVVLELAEPKTPVFVRADPLQLEQVLINLASNAHDAMPAGGRLFIGVDTVSRLPVAVPNPNNAPGPWARLSVRDTGSGMDRETANRAFDPFFTTKGMGRGTGLGLATVFGIVEQSGGHVTVDSEPGRGSEFLVFLPLADVSVTVTTLPLSGAQPPS